MLLVKTKLDKSDIQGIGLFARQFIPKGTVIWEFSASVDQKLTRAQIDSLPSPCREQIRKYSYCEKQSGLYVLCGDDARFYNHSATPNCLDVNNGVGDITVALRDIHPGEELTCDYAAFDRDWVEGQFLPEFELELCLAVGA